MCTGRLSNQDRGTAADIDGMDSGTNPRSFSHELGSPDKYLAWKAVFTLSILSSGRVINISLSSCQQSNKLKIIHPSARLN